MKLFQDEALFLFISTVILLITSVIMGVYIVLTPKDTFNENHRDCMERGGSYSMSVDGGVFNYEMCKVEEIKHY